MSNDNNKNESKNNNNSNVVKRHFILNEDVTASSVKDIILGIIEVNRHDKEKEKEDSTYIREPITLIVNSFGGDAYDGMALVSVIDTSITPVHTYCYGKAMSMGFIIFASGHKRFAHPLATFMYHELSVGYKDSIEGIYQYVGHLKELQEQYDEYIFSVTDIPREKAEEIKKTKQNWYFFAKEALEYNLVDELLISTRQK